MHIIFKKGIAGENDNYVGPLGSLSVDTTNKILRLHDGVTVGGVKIAKLEDTIDITTLESVLSGHFFIHAGSSDHDGRYYTKEQVNTLLAALEFYAIGQPMYDIDIRTGNIDGQDVTFKVGTEAGWRDLTGELYTEGGGSTAPTWTMFRQSIFAHEFESSKINQGWITFHLNHDYALGTPILPHLHWSVNTTNTGSVRWGFEWTIAKGHQQATGSIFEATSLHYVTTNITEPSQYKHFVSEFAYADGIVSSLLEPDAMLLFRIFRDSPNDTFPNSVFLLTSDLHYQSERFATKNRAPNFFE